MSFDLIFAGVDDLKQRRNQQDQYDPVLDQRLTDLLFSASRQIDTHCLRTFGRSDSAETRTFTAVSGRLVLIDDLFHLDSIDMDFDGDLVCETSWSLGESYLERLPSHLLPEVAHTSLPAIALRLAPRSRRQFPTTARAINVTGLFGWPQIPLPIREACFRLAERFETLPSAPLGIAQANVTTANSFTGQIGGTRLIMPDDSDVNRLLAPYVREWGFA